MAGEPHEPAAANEDARARATFVDYVCDISGAAAEDVREMLAAVENGERTQDFFGLAEGVLLSLEEAAHAAYQARRYEDARNMYFALARLSDGQRASAWRGVGACFQAQRGYEEAVHAYAKALLIDQDDPYSGVQCGECLCLLGRRDDGLALLQATIDRIVAAEGEEATQNPHVQRARAILAAGGGTLGAAAARTAAPVGEKQPKGAGSATAASTGPETLAAPSAAQRAVSAQLTERRAKVDAALRERERTQQAGAAGAPKAPPAAAGSSTGDAGDAGDEPLSAAEQQAVDEALMELAELNAELALQHRGEIRDEKIRAQLADGEERDNLEKIAQAVLDKSLTIRQLADFSDEQMDAAYAVVCLHLERNEVLQALQVVMMMLYIDSRDHRFYVLAGLCAHRLRMYCLADYLFHMAAIWRPGGPDAATLIYRGEAKMLSEEIDEGLAMVREGMQMGQSDPQMADLIRRGDALLRQGASMQQQKSGTLQQGGQP